MLTERLQAELDAFRERFHREPDAEDAVWLVDACKMLERPDGDFELGMIAPPVRIGGTDVRLWQRTIGSSIWLTECAFRWWGVDNNRCFWAILFSLAHARDAGTLARLTDERDAAKSVTDFCMAISATKAECELAVDRALGRVGRSEREGKESGGQADWGGVIAHLETVSGTPADEWLWGRSAEYTARAYARSVEVISAMRGAEAERQRDALDNAIEHLRAVKARICRKYSQTAEERKA